MPNARKSETRLVNFAGMGSRRMMKTWKGWWRAMNTPLGETEPTLTPPQIQGKKLVVEKKAKKDPTETVSVVAPKADAVKPK